MIFSRSEVPALIGLVHLPPLPGAPLESPGLQACLDRALADAEALALGGASGVIVENLGDAPFEPGAVEPHVVAMLAVIARALRQRFGGALVVGINALRNDAAGALGAAAASGARFVRVNVHVGAMVTDQGILQGRARETLLYRARAAPGVRIAADVLVKHAAPLGPVDLAQVARDTWHRGRADALIVTGSGTGQPTDPSDLATVRRAVPDCTLWLGSGLSPEHAPAARAYLDGAIVGTWLHRGGALSAPLDVERVRRMAGALKGE